MTKILPKTIVFTDLDGTLLDHADYSFRPALPALSLLRERRIPTIFCSSKTAAEMLPLRQAAGNKDPFIVENGGGVYIPDGYFKHAGSLGDREGAYLVLKLGAGYLELLDFLAVFRRDTGVVTRSYSDMTAAELARETGLSEQEARRSMKREFDLPFKLEDGPGVLEKLESEARRQGLRISAGGRYLHLTGDSGKGEAVDRLTRLFEEEWGRRPQTIGLGDSRNDLDMLRAVDVPVIIPNPASSAPLTELLPAARVAPAPGPEGWSSAVLSLLSDSENRSGE